MHVCLQYNFSSYLGLLKVEVKQHGLTRFWEEKRHFLLFLQRWELYSCRAAPAVGWENVLLQVYTPRTQTSEQHAALGCLLVLVKTRKKKNPTGLKTTHTRKKRSVKSSVHSPASFRAAGEMDFLQKWKGLIWTPSILGNIIAKPASPSWCSWGGVEEEEPLGVTGGKKQRGEKN